MERYATGRTVKGTGEMCRDHQEDRPSRLRHSFITAALDAGVPLRDVHKGGERR
jgi:site-specific recombinase XerD